MNKAALIQQLYLIKTYPFRGKTFIKGKGVFLYDEKGKEYLDFMSNYGVNIFGYQQPQLTRALQKQLQILPTLHCSFSNDVRALAAKSLIKRCGGKLTHVYFCNSGTEAVEAALKFSFLASGKKEVIAMKGAYHGKTFASLSVTASKKYKKGLESLLLPVRHVNFGDLKALKKAINSQTAAVILEPVQGESGIQPAASDYLKAVEKICQEKKVILILDEIQSGTGRTGYFLASHKEEIKPDIICLGKGLAGGIPVGATLVSKKISQKIPKASHTSTFGGNPLAMQGILTVLDLLDERKLKEIRDLGKIFLEKLKEIKSKQIIEVRGSGLMIGIEVKGNRNVVLKKLQAKGVLAIPAGDDVVRFLPPYIITKKDINRVIKVLKEVLCVASY